MFEEVVVSFLPVGHTHEDIDQALIFTSRRLTVNEAINIEDLQHQLQNTYNNETKVISMERVANFSQLCEEEKFLTEVIPFSHFRYFRFTRSKETSEYPFRYNTVCNVNKCAPSEWKLYNNDANGFIITPST